MYHGRLFDGQSSRGRDVVVSLVDGGLRIEGAEGSYEAPVFWAWTELPKSCITDSGRKTLVVRNRETLEVDEPTFLAALRTAHPRAERFRSPFHTWTATRTRFAITLGSSVAVMVFAFVFLVPWAGDVVAASLPPEWERMAGQSLKEQTMAGQKVHPATDRLQAFWDELDLPVRQPTHLTLVDGDTVNAFALMGGQILVYRGIVERMESADELAGVLAHEAGHAELRHSARLIGRSMAGAFLLSYVFADPTGISGAILSNVDTLRNLQFSREMETEADDWAAQVVDGKTDVRALGTLLNRIDELHLPQWTNFLSSHPATGDRAAGWNKSGSQGHASPELQRLFDELKDSL